MTQYAKTITKRCPMYDTACAETIARHISGFYCQSLDPDGNPVPFDAMPLIEAKCGRYTRGKHKGCLRGWAEVEMVTTGGWKKDGPGEGNGRVWLPGAIVSIRIADFTKLYLEVR